MSAENPEITQEILNNLKNHLEQKKPLGMFLRENNLQEQISFKDLRTSFVELYGVEEFRNLMLKSRIPQINNMLSRYVNIIDSTEECDTMIESLNSVMDSILVKKSELQSS